VTSMQHTLWHITAISGASEHIFHTQHRPCNQISYACTIPTRTHTHTHTHSQYIEINRNTNTRSPAPDLAVVVAVRDDFRGDIQVRAHLRLWHRVVLVALQWRGEKSRWEKR
jgi:hypothetical protein